MFIEMENIVKKIRQRREYALCAEPCKSVIGNGRILRDTRSLGFGKKHSAEHSRGLDSADEGRLNVGGEELSSMSKKALAKYRREKVGIVFQTYNLIGELTAKENVRVVSDISEDPLDTEELLDELGLQKHKTHFPSELSGGQQQRCAIARAIVKNPDILLCDEPTGALDSSSSRDVLQLLQNVNEKYGTTVVLITHNEAIAGMADRVVRIHDGRITENNAGPGKSVRELMF